MTVLTKSFRAMSVPDLVAAVNTWLALQVGGSSIILIQADIIYNLLPRRMLKQGELQCVISFDDAGAAAQTDPFVLAFAQASNPDALDTAMAAIYAAVGLLFRTGFRVISQDEPSQLPQMLAWCLTSDDAAAITNYTPL